MDSTEFTTEEISDYELLREMLVEAMLRRLRPQWGQVGMTKAWWIEVPCDAETYAAIKKDARKQIRLEEQRQARIERIKAARAELMGAASC